MLDIRWNKRWLIMKQDNSALPEIRQAFKNNEQDTSVMLRNMARPRRDVGLWQGK